MASNAKAQNSLLGEVDYEYRAHKNRYDDFNENRENPFLCKDSYKIKPEFLARLQNKATSMLDEFVKLLNRVDTRRYSVYTGAAGITMMFDFAGERLNSVYSQYALSLLDQLLPNLNNKYPSFLNGDSGPQAIGAVLYNKCGQSDRSQLLIKRFQNVLPQITELSSNIPDELLYGRVGYLFGQMFINKYLGAETIDSSSIKAVVQSIIASGRTLAKKEKSTVPLLFKWHNKNYVGAAHGTVGILYILLLAQDHVSDSDMSNLIQPTIDNILTLRLPQGNLQSSVGNEKDRLVQWCHGAPGAISLFCLAYKVFGDEKYKAAALDFGDVVWERGLLTKGSGLCHGTAGNAYSFLSIYQLLKMQKNVPTEETAKYLYRACAFADWCLNTKSRKSDHPLSLFEGRAGTIYFLMDILEPERAGFPAYDL